MFKAKFIPVCILGLIIGISLNGCTGSYGNHSFDEILTMKRHPGMTFKAVSGNTIIGRYGDNDQSIFGISLLDNNRFAVCSSPGMKPNIRISGNIVVWQDGRYGNQDIFGYDLKSRAEFPVCVAPEDQITPQVSANYIAWQNKKGEIYCYNLKTKETTNLLLKNRYYSYNNPDFELSEGQPFDLDGNTIVWVNQGKVFACDLTRKEEYIITDGGVKGDVCIHDNILVWLDITPTSPLWKKTSKGDLVAYNISTQKVTSLPKTAARIYGFTTDGNYVIWYDERESKATVYAYDLSTGEEFRLGQPYWGQQLDIDNNVMIWSDQESTKAMRISRTR